MMYGHVDYAVIPLDEEEQCLTPIPEEDDTARTDGDEESPDVGEDEDIEENWKKWHKSKLNSDLLKAVITGNHEEVQRLIEKGASPNARCRESLVSACHLAALRDDENILQTILQACKTDGYRSSPAVARDLEGRQPHHLAAAAGSIKTLRLLLEEEPNLIDSPADPQSIGNITEDDFDSFLHDHSQVSRLLIHVPEGSTALHMAARYSQKTVIDFLINERNADKRKLDCANLTPACVAGVGVNIQEKKRYFDGIPVVVNGAKCTPISTSPFSKRFRKKSNETALSVERSSSQEEVTEVVLSLVDSTTKFENLVTNQASILHKMVQNSDAAAIKSFCHKIRTKIQGTDNSGLLMYYTTAADDDGRTPAHFAAETSSLECLKVLLQENNGVINSVDKAGRSLLYIAVEKEWLEGVELILEYKPDFSVATLKRKETVLHLAARLGNFLLLRILVLHSTRDVRDKKDIDGFKPLARAVESSSIACIELLLDKFSGGNAEKMNLILISLKGDFTEKLIFLINFFSLSSVNINSKLDEVYNMIHYTVKENSLNCLKYLLSREDVDVTSKSEGGMTILHLAAQTGNIDALKIILDNEKSCKLISVKDEIGREPLLWAAINGNTDCIIALLKHGANIAAKDRILEKNAIDIIFNNSPHLDWIFDEVFDSFIVKKEINQKKFSVDLNFQGLLADANDSESKLRVKRQLGVVEAFIDCRQERLKQKFFLHPIVECFLFLKWKLLNQFFNFTIFLVAAQIFSVTLLTLMMYTYDMPLVLWISRLGVLCTGVPIVLLEVLLVVLDQGYLGYTETWVKWAVTVSSVLVCVLDGEPLIRYVAAVAVLLAWIEVLFLLANSRHCGLRILMFFEVAKNVFEVLTTFIFLLLGFAFSFLILFNGEAPFSNLWTTLTKVVIMMVELDYNAVFGQSEDGIPLPIFILGRLFYVGFLVLVVMVLTNLLVGMSVTDVAELEARGMSKKMAKEASFLVLFEKICYQKECLKIMPRFLSNLIIKYRAAPEKVTISSNPSKSGSELLPNEMKNFVFEALHKKEQMIKDDSLHEKVNEICQKLNIVYSIPRICK